MIGAGLKIWLNRIEIAGSGVNGVCSFATKITVIIITFVQLLFLHSFHVELYLIIFET